MQSLGLVIWHSWLAGQTGHSGITSGHITQLFCRGCWAVVERDRRRSVASTIVNPRRHTCGRDNALLGGDGILTIGKSRYAKDGDG